MSAHHPLQANSKIPLIVDGAPAPIVLLEFDHGLLKLLGSKYLPGSQDISYPPTLETWDGSLICALSTNRLGGVGEGEVHCEKVLRPIFYEETRPLTAWWRLVLLLLALIVGWWWGGGG